MNNIDWNKVQFKVGTGFKYDGKMYSMEANGMLKAVSSKYDFLPYDVKNVIINQNTVIVNLKDGRKGISKCSYNDEFDNFTGFTIAYYKAKNSKSFKLKEVLDSCVQSASEKGYHNAILKNE